MKLSVFIQKVLEETNADTVDFDVSVKLRDKELIVISDQKHGDLEIFGTRLKFTIIKSQKSYVITSNGTYNNNSPFSYGVINYCSCTPTNQGFTITDVY